jgi:hypothetical protein
MAILPSLEDIDNNLLKINNITYGNLILEKGGLRNPKQHQQQPEM